jgi:hypothetical protein
MYGISEDFIASYVVIPVAAAANGQVSRRNK